MRRIAFIGLGALAAAGCGGGEPRENLARPPVPITMTAAIQDDVVRVSPASVGAGPIRLVIANQSDRPQTVTFETDELGGKTGGVRATSRKIVAHGTGGLTIDARRGTYSVRVGDRAIRPARVEVGPPRPSAQNQVLLP